MGFPLQKRVKSFHYAFRGIKHLIASQHNAWIHLFITTLVAVSGFVAQLSQMEWCVIILTVMIVWAAEGLNTAIEFLSDTVSTGHHPLIEKAKDIAAGAVLIAAIGAAIVGIIIFYPHYF